MRTTWGQKVAEVAIAIGTIGNCSIISAESRGKFDYFEYVKWTLVETYSSYLAFILEKDEAKNWQYFSVFG